MATADRPLAGQTVVVTRSRSQASKLADHLETLGAMVIEFPCIEIRTTTDTIDINPSTFDWVIFTSANTVRCLHEKMNNAGIPFEFPEAQICSVGPATCELLDAYGIKADCIPETYTAEHAFEALSLLEPDLSKANVLLPQGNLANPYLRDALTSAGASITTPVVYETICPNPDDTLIKDLLDSQPDWVTFTSGSTVRNFTELLGQERLLELSERTRFASIGPQTTRDAEEAGLLIALEAARHDIPGLVAALLGFGKK